MKYTVSVLAALALLVGVGFAIKTAHPKSAISTVYISDELGHGSGVHIGSGYILTAAHVVEGHDVVTITDSAGNVQSGIVLWANKKYDVALVSIGNFANIPDAKLNCHPVFSVGDQIRAVGSPINLKFVTTWGRVSVGVAHRDPWEMSFLADISIAPGMSGGPVFDGRGQVVGITVGVSVATLSGFPSMYGLSYIVPSTAACLLLAEARS